VTLAPGQHPSLFDGPHRSGRPAFDGVTYSEREDGARLGRQLAKVLEVLSDGQWHTPAELEALTGYGWASISARCRDLRKVRHGGHEVQRRRREPAGAGVWEYRLVVNAEDRT
jgi:hypothetical protein